VDLQFIERANVDPHSQCFTGAEDEWDASADQRHATGAQQVRTGGGWHVVCAAEFQVSDRFVELFVSPLTAKTHVNRAMMKLGVRDRAQLVVLAYQSGLIRASGRNPT
jgi:ATP/maltotriose-dependent transcriptional regulator MalT